jgi:superfamily II DNA or RNA helicase
MSAESNRILTTKGYSIRKSSLSAEETERIQKELLVAPKVNSKYMGKAQLEALSFKVYRESPSRWYLPRAWATQVFGPPEHTVVPEGVDLRSDLVFQGKPYDYQEAIMASFVNAGANGLICVPCGKGKTFMALGIAAKLKKRFLVVVDKEFLMNQWKGEMEALFPGIRIGIIQEDNKQIGDIEEPAAKEPGIPELKETLRRLGLKVGGTKEILLARLKEANATPISEPVVKEKRQYDCSIALIQTLIRREFSPTDFESFGFTIFDECHHLGAQHFSKTLQRVQTAKMLGLSATPTREDGLTKVFTWFIGEPIYWEKTREPDPTVEVKGVNIETQDVVYNTIPTDWRGEPVTARLLTNVLGCAERNKKILEWILRLMVEPRRRLLILSERIGHLNTLEEMVRAADAALTLSYYVGGMKEEVREAGAATARIILASYAMASEAMNIKTLNTVLLASPRKAVEQSTGRILRIRPDQREVPPIIVDIIDSHQMYQSQWRKRLEYYRKCSYQIERWSMTGESGTPMVAKKVKETKSVSKCLIDTVLC